MYTHGLENHVADLNFTKWYLADASTIYTTIVHLSDDPY